MDVELALTIDGEVFKFPGGQVKNLSIDLAGWGYEAELDFWVSYEEKLAAASRRHNDKLYELFCQHGLIEVALKLVATQPPPGDSPPEPLFLTGLVTHKRLFEESYPDVEGQPVLYRRYWIRFLDPMQVLWRQHWPSTLYTQKSMQQVLDEHKGRHLRLSYAMAAAAQTRPLIFLGLGAPGNEASLYDLLVWWLDEHNGELVYESSTNEYKLRDAKDAVANAGLLDPLDVESLEVVIGECPRYGLSVMNARASLPAGEQGKGGPSGGGVGGDGQSRVEARQIDSDRTDVGQVSAVAGLRRDIVVREPVPARFQALVARRQERLRRLVNPAPELEVSFARWPTITLRPGSWVSFEREGWSSQAWQSGRAYRVRSMRVRAAATVQSHHEGLYESSAGYMMEVGARLQAEGCPVVELPPYVPPRYPVRVEGRVVSEQGQQGEETYQFYQDPETSQDQCKVRIERWEQVVPVEFHPNTMPGHFYFPYYRDQRVLVALEFDAAWIERFLDWREGAQLPLEGQGNHLVLGKTPASRTSVSHYYADNKPILKVLRTLDKDTVLIQLEEGKLTLQTREEESS